MMMQLQLESPKGILPFAMNIDEHDHIRKADLLRRARRALFNGKGSIDYCQLIAVYKPEQAIIRFVPQS